MRLLILALSLPLALGGCDRVFGLDRPAEPRIDADASCTSNDGCTAGGARGTCTCGQCSYYDSTCPATALRWAGDANGEMSNACVATIERIDAHVFHTCATMTDGTGWCWGMNSSGQLGAAQPISVDSSAPVRVRSNAGVQHDIVELRTGAGFTCARLTNGTVACWGNNTFGQLGAGLPTGPMAQSSDPVIVQTESGAALADVTSLSVGYISACAIVAPPSGAKQIYCWGSDSYGELGTPPAGGLRNHAAAVVGLPPGDLLAVGVAGEHACAIVLLPGKPEANTYCWGRQADGRLGNASVTDQAEPSPQQVQWMASARAPFPAAIVLAPGNRTMCAIKQPPGELYCWGANSTGAIGDGTRITRAVATPTVGPPGERSVLATGDRHACGMIGTDLACWGSDSSGQLGNGPSSTADQLAPVVVIPGLRQRDLTAGYEHTCALDSTRQLRCWGANPHGELGIGTMVDQAAPVEIPAPSFCPGP